MFITQELAYLGLHSVTLYYPKPSEANGENVMPQELEIQSAKLDRRQALLNRIEGMTELPLPASFLTRSDAQRKNQIAEQKLEEVLREVQTLSKRGPG